MAKKSPKKAHRYYETAGGVVLNARDEVLLLERHVPREEGLRHEIRLPKGHIDPGETAARAAQREVCEESGYCELEILAPLGEAVVEYEFRGTSVTRREHYFLMRLRRDENVGQDVAPNSEEALFEPLWVHDLEEAARLLTYEAEQAVARRALDAWQRLRTG